MSHPLGATARTLALLLALASAHAAPGARAQPTSPEVAAYIDVGRRALERGDFEEAALAFSLARRHLPDAPELMRLEAAALVRLGRHEEVVALLGALIARGEDDFALRRNLGLSLHRLGRHAEAQPHLALALDAQGEDDELRYHTGLNLLHLGRHREAIACLDALAAEDGPWRTMARFSAATASYRAGRFDDARARFSRVLDEGGPDSPLAAQARTMIALAEARARPWDLAVLIELEHDDNVLQMPESAGALPLPAPESDFALRLIATFAYRPPLFSDLRPADPGVGPSGGLTLRYTAFLRELFTVDAQDLFGHLAQLGWSPTHAGRGLSLGYQLEHFLLAYDHYLLAHRLQVGHGLGFGDWVARLGYRLRFKDFADRYDLYDGLEHGPELDLTFSPGRWRLACAYRFTHEDNVGSGRIPSGSEYAYFAHRAGLRLAWQPLTRLTLQVAGAYERRDYLHENPLRRADGSIGERADDRFEVQAEVVWRALSRTTLQLGWQHAVTSSNVAVYSYDKHIVRAGLGHAF